MPATNSSSNCVLQPRSSWRSRVVLCVLAFVATGAAVYRLGTKQAHRADRYMAAATIRHPLGPSDAPRPGGSEPLPGPDAASVEAKILSRQSLQRALRKLDFPGDDAARSELLAGPDQTIEQVRRSLRVTSTKTSQPAELQISILCTDEDPGRVVRLVNALAEGYAEEHRAKREATAGKDYLEAQAAAEQARREFLEAKGRFDDFVQGHFLKQQTLAERPVEGPSAPPSVAGSPSGGPVEPARPQTADPPEKIELERLLADLEQHRAQLLIDRTPVHPAVLDLEAKIGRVKERLASIPHRGPDERSETPPPAEAPSAEPPAVEGFSDIPDGGSPAETVEEYAEAVGEFHTLKEALDRAGKEYDRLSDIKRQAWEAHNQPADIELELAETSELCPSADHSPRLLLAALAAALAVGAGVGLIKSGFDTDPPLVTPDQAERALPVPIVGVIPATGPPTASARQPRSRPASGLTKIIYGVLLIAICFGVLVIVY